MADKKDKFYAWSTIIVGDEDGLKSIGVGSEVTASDLATDDEGFNAYLLSGAVRPYEYPDIPATQAHQSPLEFMRAESLKDVQAEEEQLAAVMNPDIARASVGPVPLSEPVMLEGTEEATGPSEEASPPKK